MQNKSPQYELNLRDYARIIRKRKFVVISTFFVAVLGSVFLAPEDPTIYKATASIKIEERKTVAGLLTEWIIYTPGNIMQSEANMIKGFNVARTAA